MKRQHAELRIGIADTSTLFHGQLDGYMVDFDDQLPLRLTIVETLINHSAHYSEYRLSLLTNRPHLYLIYRPGQETSLSMVSLPPTLEISGTKILVGSSIARKLRYEKRWRYAANPPTPDAVLEEIPGILLQGGIDNFYEWFGRMTPEGWELPTR